MDLTLTPDQEAVRAAARRFLASECPPARVRAMAEAAGGFSRELWRALAEQGWHGWALPADEGGLGQSFFDLGLLIEELGGAAVPSPFVISTVLGARAIASFGSAAQRREVLPALIAGDRVVTVATGGWGDDEGPAVKAREDGDGFVLEGRIALVPYADAADRLIVVARDDAHTSAFLVPGAAIACRSIDVIGGDPRCDVTLGCVRVARDALLGERRRGEDVAQALTLWGAAARSAELVGLGRRVLELTVAHAEERVAFGRPIGALQAIQHHLADMAVDLLGARLVTYEALWRISEADAGATEAVAIAKSFAGDRIAGLAARGHQVHGAMGFTWEHDLHLYTRRIRAAELDFGDGARHRHHLATARGI